MKKILSVLVIGVLMFSFAFAADFTDVNSSFWGYYPIMKMKEAGIISGYTDGTFKPANNINLGEFATIFTKVFKIPESTNNFFKSVPADHWAKGRIEAVKNYILFGHTDSSDYINASGIALEVPADVQMSRESVVYALTQAYGFDRTNYDLAEAELIFEDYAEMSDPISMLIAYKEGIMVGEKVDGKIYLRPQRNISRAEFSALLSNLIPAGKDFIENDEIEKKEVEEAAKAALEDLKSGELNLAISHIDFPEYFFMMFDVDMYLIEDDYEFINKYLNSIEYKNIIAEFDGFNKAKVNVDVKYFNLLEDAKNILSTEESKSDLVSAVRTYVTENDLMNKEFEVVENKIVLDFTKENGKWMVELNDDLMNLALGNGRMAI